jgi:hypothetical protein
MNIKTGFTGKDKAELFMLLYKLEDHLEDYGHTDTAPHITDMIRKLNDLGIRE